MSTVQSLTEHVFNRVVDDGASARTVDLVLAALAGDDALTSLLEDDNVPDKPETETPRAPPDGAYLTSVTVEGFRGIGSRAPLTLIPGPGLTVIAGRNGSGKSSFAEALECGLTGTTARWSRKVGMDLGSAWRNLHHGHPCTIEIGVVQAEQPPAVIRVEWTRDATDPAAAAITYQRQGERREAAADRLGWSAALETFRPLMTYEDLGRLATSRPSELHDSIARALGLDDLHGAIAILKARAKPLKEPLRRTSTERIQLRKDLEELDDDRATSAARLLSKTSPDLNAVGRLLTDSTADDGRASTLSQIQAAALPTAQEVEDAAHELDAARWSLSQIGEQRGQIERTRDRLLRDALSLHQEAGDAPCPVCGTGYLDAEWRRAAEQTVTVTDLLANALRDAEAREEAARAAAQRLIRPGPAVLGQSTMTLVSQDGLAAQWAAWAAPLPVGALAQHLRSAYAGLAGALQDWQQEARGLADEVAARWQPFAQRLMAWMGQHAEATSQADRAAELDLAAKAAEVAERALQGERLKPIVERALAVWAQLKQESNVELIDVKLTGAANRRTVDIQAVIDEIGADALPVMSQGELNSLALALYLPRATSEESPFRFLVLDDPVQAMDPTKVEGLAAVLSELAKTRQVIVFSHDDRLAQAARRLPKVPHLLQVVREPSSQVVVQRVVRPSERHLNDAYAMLKDPDLLDGVKRQVLPGSLRQAIEAAAWERYCTEQLRQGSRLADLETAWDEADRTRAKLELVLADGFARWLGRDHRRDLAIRVCNSGMHRPITSDLQEAYANVRALVQAVESRTT